MRSKKMLSTVLCGGLCLSIHACLGSVGPYQDSNVNTQEGSYSLSSEASADETPADQCDCAESLCLPADATIDSATLTLNVNWAHIDPTKGDVVGDLVVHRVTSSWLESAATWNTTVGNYDTNIETTIVLESHTGTVAVDITDLVSQWVYGIQPNYGLLLDAPLAQGTAYAKLHSTESTVAEGPTVTIRYSSSTGTVEETFSGESFGLADTYVMENEPNLNGEITPELLFVGKSNGYAKQSLLQWQMCTPPEPQTCQIGDFVWHDENGDGQQNDGTGSGLDGVEVAVYACSDPSNPVLVAEDETVAGGLYSFDVPCNGDYSVTFTPPTGMVPTTPNSGDDAQDSDIVLPGTGETACVPVSGIDLTIDAGFVHEPPTPCTLGDFVWHDVVQDGLQGQDEPNLEGVTVNLFDCHDNPVASTVTDDAGAYAFEVVCDGSYYVEFIAPDGMVETTPNSGNDAEDSDVLPSTGATECIPIAGDDPTIDAGYVVALCSLGDFVWHDLNENGIQDAGEPGIGSASVTVRECGDEEGFTDSMLSGSLGEYEFEVPCGASYAVEFVAPAASDMVLTGSDQGGDDSADSDADPATSSTPCVVVTDDDMSIDAGFVDVLEPCGECEGKLTELMLQYNGPSGASVAVYPKKKGKKDGDVVLFQSGSMNPGDLFTVYGYDKNGTLGTEISLFIGDELNAKIHTSCSQPIGPGLIAGDFEVIKGYSREGGLLCPAYQPPEYGDCECDGKVTDLLLEYLGGETALIRVEPKNKKKKGKKGKKGKKDDSSENVVLYQGDVEPGEQFSVSGHDDKGTLGTEISVYVDGELNIKIHTSCSQPIGPGLIAGDFKVVDGSSLKGGPLCPLY